MKTHSATFSLLFPALAAFAADVTWDNEAGDGQWGTAANWSNDAVPTAADNVTIPVAALPADAVIHLGADREVNSVAFTGNNNTGILTGDGQYALTVMSGPLKSDSGSAKGVYDCPVVLRKTVQMYSNSWGTRTLFTSLVTDGGAGFGINCNSGAQNSNVHFTGPVRISGPVTNRINTVSFGVSASTLDPGGNPLGTGGTLESASEFVIDSNGLGYSGNLLTTLALDNRAFAVDYRVGRGIPVRLAEGGGQIYLYGHPSTPVHERIDVVEHGFSRLALVVEPKTASVPVDFTVGEYRRAPGTHLIANIKSGATLRVLNAANNEAGIWAPWAVATDYNFLTVVSDETRGTYVTSLPMSSYAALLASGNEPGVPSRLQNGQVSLESDEEVYALRMDGNQPFLHLGTHDFTVRSGAIMINGNGPEGIDSAGGVLRFAGEELILALRCGNKNSSLELSAPMAWSKPADSTAEYPNLILVQIEANGPGVVRISSEDLIGDYGSLSIPATYNVNSDGCSLEFAGPSDRTFHGGVFGAGRLVQGGPGRISFLGNCFLRHSTLSVTNGTLAISGTGYPDCAVADAGTFLVNGVTYTAQAKPQAGGTIGGTGSLSKELKYNATASKNYFPDGIRFAPGDGDVPGTLTVHNLTPSGSFGIDVVVSPDANGTLAVAYSNSSKLDLGSVAAGSTLAIDIADPSKGRAKLSGRELPVLTWKSLSGDFATAFQTVSISTSTPRFVDVSHAEWRVDAQTKTLYVSGLVSSGMATMVLVK